MIKELAFKFYDLEKPLTLVKKNKNKKKTQRQNFDHKPNSLHNIYLSCSWHIWPIISISVEVFQKTGENVKQYNMSSSFAAAKKTINCHHRTQSVCQ